MNFSIEDFASVTLNRGILRSNMQAAHTATVKFDNGDWAGVSRYHDEEYWIVDCAFRANGYPMFSNGTGSRVTVANIVEPTSDVAKALNGRL